MDRTPENKKPNMFPEDSFRTDQTYNPGYFNEELGQQIDQFQSRQPPQSARNYQSNEFEQISNMNADQQTEYYPQRAKSLNNFDNQPTLQENYDNYPDQDQLKRRKTVGNLDKKESNQGDANKKKLIGLIKIDDVVCNDGQMQIKITSSHGTGKNGKGHTLYEIKGQDSLGFFTIERRYREFHLFYDILFSRYPGLFIPPIPSKTNANKSVAVLEERKLFLEQFLKSIASQRHLASLPEVQVFLRPPSGSCMDSLKSLEKQTTTTLLQFFEFKVPLKQFINYYGDSTIDTMNTQLRDFIKIQGQQIQKIHQFKNYSLQSVSLKDEELKYYKQFTEFLGGYEETQLQAHEATSIIAPNVIPPTKIISGDGYLKGQLELLTNHIQNPFKHISNWTKGELMNLESLVAAISEKEACTARKAKAIDRLRQNQNDLAKMGQGKFLFKTMFKSQTGKEQLRIRLITESEQLEADIRNWDAIKKYLTVYQAEIAIPWFKTRVHTGYQRAIIEFSSEEAENAKKMLTCWSKFLEHAQKK